MKTIELKRKNYSRILPGAIRAVKSRKVLVCPTDTVYGLICDATNKEAVRRLLKIKRRPKGKPIPIFVRDIKMAKKFAFIDKRQEAFLREHWPGRVTAVLKSISLLPKSIGAKNTIGLRIPDYPFLRRLLNQIKKPLTGTSANISGQPPSGEIKEVLRQFKGRKYQPDLVIDAGDLPKRKPSKVIDLTAWPPKVLRS